MSAPRQLRFDPTRKVNMLQKAAFCLNLAWFLSMSTALEFMQPQEVLSKASTSCVVASSFTQNSLIELIQHLDDVSFASDPLVNFAVINIKLFKWPNDDDLVVKSEPSTVINESDLILFRKIKRDRTCLLVPEGEIKIPDIHVYRGPFSLDLIIDFINSYCETYRKADGSVTDIGIARDELRENLFHVKGISDNTMGNLLETKFQDNDHSIPQFCETTKDDLQTCMNRQMNIKTFNKYAYKHLTVPKCDKIDVPSKEEFIENYLKRSKPVIIKGATSSWQAFSKWTNAFFREQYGERIVHIKLTPKGEFEGVEPVSIWEDFGNFVIPEAVKSQLQFPDLVVVRPATLNIQISEFLDMVESISNGSLTKLSAYLEYTSIRDIMHELENDIEEMPFFQNILELKHSNIWLSDGNTLGKTHFDPYDNFLCMISGRKEVIMFDPHNNDQLYEAHIPEAILSYNSTDQQFRRKKLLDSTSMVMTPVDILKPDFERFPKFAAAYPLNCTIEEGEVLFMPAFWWHEVQSYPNTQQGRNLAVNYWYDPFFTKEFPCPECKLDVNPEYRHLL